MDIIIYIFIALSGVLLGRKTAKVTSGESIKSQTSTLVATEVKTIIRNLLNEVSEDISNGKDVEQTFSKAQVTVSKLVILEDQLKRLQKIANSI
jgi:hypothetical protein